ncbi:MAG: MarC family protein [Verrucomicrobiota bacterium]
MIDIVSTFIFFFAVVDPIGTVPVYLAVTHQFDPKSRRKIAFKAVLFAVAVLIFFVIAGEYILTAIDIPLSAFQIAGGIVLFLFALSMIFGESKPEHEVQLAEAEENQTAIFPLAVPSIAGPGAILAAVLQTENAKFSFVEQIEITIVMLAVLSVTLTLMLCASGVHKLIGNSGASIISRVMGLILASVAVRSVLSGITEYFGLAIGTS